MTYIRHIELKDAHVLFYHLSNPHVLRYSRLKPNSVEEMEEAIMYLKREEEEKRLISRVIVNEHEHVVGMITLWDYCPFRREGFLSTLLGELYWGKGYNQIAKNLFLDEVFSLPHLEKIYLLVRNYNSRSIAACQKIDYIDKLNLEEEIELREFYGNKISKDHIVFYIDKYKYINKKEASL